jgi:hypothetical protein
MANVATIHSIDGARLAVPENIEAEASLLGALLIENPLIAKLAGKIAAEDFYEPVHARVFAAIKRWSDEGKQVNATLLRPEFEADEGLSFLGGASYLFQLTADDAGLLAPFELAEQIRALATRRRTIAALEDAVRAYRDTSDDAALPDLAALLEPAKEASRNLSAVDAFDFDENKIPVRPWLIPGAMLRGYTHILAAPGGSGKSLFTLQIAIAMARGEEWGGFKPRGKYRSLIINLEDDLDEQHRRLAAASRVMGAPDAGMIYLADATDGFVVAQAGERTNSMVTTPIVKTLRRFIEAHKIDAVFVDPFAETFEGDENDNSQVKWAMRVWRDDIARGAGCAVYLPHHTTKHAQNGAGDANIVRGAGAIVNSTRISATLMPMTPEDAASIGIDPATRHLYVRYDDAKANQSLKTTAAKWFRKETVELTNATEDCPADYVGALVPWSPPDAFDGLSSVTITVILDKIETGLDNGTRYTASTRGGTIATGRWAGTILMDLAGMNEAQAKKVIATWIKSGVLLEDEYQDPIQRKLRTGLFAPESMRPRAPE